MAVTATAEKVSLTSHGKLVAGVLLEERESNKDENGAPIREKWYECYLTSNYNEKAGLASIRREEKAEKHEKKKPTKTKTKEQ